MEAEQGSCYQESRLYCDLHGRPSFCLLRMSFLLARRVETRNCLPTPLHGMAREFKLEWAWPHLPAAPLLASPDMCIPPSHAHSFPPISVQALQLCDGMQDCRVLPDKIFGLDLGDAEYIRNAGGRVTDDVIRCPEMIRPMHLRLSTDHKAQQSFHAQSNAVTAAQVAAYCAGAAQHQGSCADAPHRYASQLRFEPPLEPLSLPATQCCLEELRDFCSAL